MLSTLRPCCGHDHDPHAQPVHSMDNENCTPQRARSNQEQANAFFLEDVQPAIKALRSKAWSEAQLLELLLHVWNARVTSKASASVTGKTEDAVRLQLQRMMKQLPKRVIDFASDATEDEQRILFESIKASCSSQGRQELMRAAGWQSGVTEDCASNET